jgi:hypothetical protein
MPALPLTYPRLPTNAIFVHSVPRHSAAYRPATYQAYLSARFAFSLDGEHRAVLAAEAGNGLIDERAQLGLDAKVV